MVWTYKRRCADTLMRRCGRLDIVGSTKGRGELKKYWNEIIRHNMENLKLIENILLDSVYENH